MPSRRDVLTGLSAAGAAGFAGCIGVDEDRFSAGTDEDADWPMARFDPGNAGYSPDAAAPRESVAERWTLEGEFASGPPVVVDGTVLVPTADGLLAVDAADGERLWRFAPEERFWSASPVVHGGTAFVAGDGSLHAVVLEGGEGIWSLPTDDRVAGRPHLVAGEHVAEPYLYVGTEGGELLRVDPAGGEVTWRTDLFGRVTSVAHEVPSLYVGTGGGEMYAFTDHGDPDRPPTGRWRRKVGSRVEAVLPDEECVLVQCWGGPTTCLQDGAHAGTTRWELSADVANAAPVSTDYTHLTAGYDSLAAVRDYDHEIHWRLRGRFDRCDPVGAGDRLYVSDGDSVHAVALSGGRGAFGFRTGATRWSHPTPGAATGLAVGAGLVVAAGGGTEGSDTTVYALESPGS